MRATTVQQKIPVYHLEPDEIGRNPHFRVYNFEGSLPHQAELLVPHRKEHYLLVFIRKAANRQWIDMTPYVLKEHTIYFSSPNEIIVKEGFNQLWSTGIAFTKEFLSYQESASLNDLPLIQNPQKGHELSLSETDILFVEDMLSRINTEYKNRTEWQQRMLSAYLTVLLTYLSRLYTEQYPDSRASTDKLLLKKFQLKVNECFRAHHEVGDYASLLHVSAGHLSELVKMHSGKPAIKHIHERILLEARRLLFHTDNTLKEIAFDLGFADDSYFNRFFKRESGETPAGYRSSSRKMYH